MKGEPSLQFALHDIGVTLPASCRCTVTTPAMGHLPHCGTRGHSLNKGNFKSKLVRTNRKKHKVEQEGVIHDTVVPGFSWPFETIAYLLSGGMSREEDVEKPLIFECWEHNVLIS